MVSKPGSAHFRGRPRARPRPRGRPTGGAVPRERGRLPSGGASRSASATPPRLVAFAMTRVDGLDASRGGAVGDVERHEPAEARVAHDRSRRDARRAGARARVRSRSGARRGTAASRGCAAAASTDRARRRCRSSSRKSCRRVASSSRLHTTAPRRTSSWPPRYFVALWSTKSAPCSSGRRWIGVAAVESTTTVAGCAAAASRSGIVRNGFDGASSQTSCTSSGGGPVWSNSTVFSPQRASSPNSRPVPKYAPSASAIVAPGSSSARTSAAAAPVPEGKSSACPPSSSPSAASAATPAGCA